MNSASKHKMPVTPSTYDERFSISPGPCKIIARDGKILKEPEIVAPVIVETKFDSFSLRRDRERKKNASVDS